MAPALVALLLSASPYVYSSQERLDHRGQVSLDTALLFENVVASGKGGGRWGGLAEVAAGIPLGASTGRIVVGVRAGPGQRFGEPGTDAWLSALVLYRGYAGGDQPWKTFLELGLVGRVLPFAGILARAGAGVQLDVSENLGLFLKGGVALGGGSGFQLQADGGLGLQLRFGTPG